MKKLMATLTALVVIAASTTAVAQDDKDAKQKKQLEDSIKGAKGVTVFLDRIRPIELRIRHKEKPLRLRVLVTHTTLNGGRGAPPTWLKADANGIVRLKGKNGYYRFSIDPEESGFYAGARAKLGFKDESLKVLLEAKKALSLRSQLIGPKAPLASVEVELRGANGVFRGGKTDQDGKLTIDRLAPGKYILTAFPKGYLSSSVAVQVPRPPKAGALRLKLEAPQARRPVIARVFVVEGGKRSVPADALTIRVAGVNFPVKNGIVNLGQESLGWDPTHRLDQGRDRYALAKVEGLPLKQRPVVFLLHRKQLLQVRLVANGKPVGGAKIYLEQDAKKHRPPAALPDETSWLKMVPGFKELKPGLYQGPLLAPGEAIAVGVACPGYAPREAIVALDQSAASTVTLQAIFHLNGEFANSDRSAKGASLVLVNASDPRNGPVAETYADPKGAFSFKRVIEGKYTLYAVPNLAPLFTAGSRTAQLPGWNRVTVSLPLKGQLRLGLRSETHKASGTVTVGEAPNQVATYLKTSLATLDKDAVLRKKLLPEGYQGPLNRHVVVWPKGAALEPHQFVGAARVDAAGRFELHVPRGKYMVGLLLPFGQQLYLLAREAEIGPKAKPLRFRLDKIR